jgi:predicted porin
MKNRMRNALSLAALLSAAGFTTTAQAADELTWHGLTLYGTYDIGLVHQTHGAPVSKDWGVGTAYLIAKNSDKPQTTIAPNGLSQSRIGLKGKQDLGGGVAFVFNLEVGFNPQSARLSDGLASLAYNNGRALDQQRSAGDASRAGQLFNGPAFVGLSSKELGTLTAGRNNTVLLDNIGRYDPMNSSYAFSVIGLQGATSGGGYTQDARADNSLKYNGKWGGVRLAALYQVDSGHGGQGTGWQLNAGFDGQNFSVDAVYASKKDGVSAASLNAAQARIMPRGSLAAVVSDNTAWTIDGSYTLGAFKLYAGFERIEFENPSRPLRPGFTGLGGYTFSVVNNEAFPHAKHLDVSWLGVKYAINKDFDLTGAYYHYNQNAYGKTICHERSAANCSGQLDAYSVRLVWHNFAKRFDAYTGAMFSSVSDGLAAGYLHRSTIDPMVGVRFQF